MEQSKNKIRISEEGKLVIYTVKSVSSVGHKKKDL